MPYGPAVIGIPAKEKADRQYGTAGVQEELLRSARANTETTQDPFQQQRKGERSRVQAPANPGAMTEPTADPRTRNPDQVDAYVAERYNRPGTDVVPRGGGPGLKSVAPPSTDLPVLDPPPTPFTTGDVRLSELNKMANAQGKTGAQAYLEDVLGTARGNVKSGGEAIAAIAKGEDVGPNLLKAGASALGLFGLPFLYAGGEVVQTGIEANPLMRDRFHQLLGQYGIKPDDNTQPSVRIAIADQVLQEFENAAHDAASNEVYDPGTRISAAVVSGLIKSEQFAELGGPQGAMALKRLAAIMAAKAAPAARLASQSLLTRGRAIPPPEDLAARTGGQGAPSTAASRTIADTSPEAIAAQQEIARMTKERSDALLVGDTKAAAAAEEQVTAAVGKQVAAESEATRLRLEAIAQPMAEFHEGATLATDTAKAASASGGTALGPLLTKAITQAQERVSKLAIKGGTSGLSLNELDDVLLQLTKAAEKDGRAIPRVIIEPLLDLRSTLWDQTVAQVGAEWKSAAELDVLRSRAAAASKAETAATRGDRGTFAAARALNTAQTRLEQAAGSLGRATEDAQVVATRRLATKAKETGAAANAAEGAVATTVKAGEQAASAIDEVFNATKTHLVETGDSFRTDIQNRANRMVTVLTERADRIRASLAADRLATRLRSVRGEAQYGYMSPDDAMVWDKGRIHTGKYDDPNFASDIAEFYRRYGDKVESALRHITHDDMLHRISDDLGIDYEALAKSLPKTEEVTRRLYIAQQVLGVMTREWRVAAGELEAGRITPAEFDAVSGRLIEFSRATSEGISEVGRALGAQRLIKRTASAELVQANVEVKRRKGTLEATTQKLDDLSAQAVKALEDANLSGQRSDVITASLVAAAEEARTAAQEVAKATTASDRAAANALVEQVRFKMERLQSERAQIQNASSTRVRDAQTRLEQHMEAVDSARAEYDAAVKKAADAAKEANDVYVARAIRMGASPEQLRVIAQIEPENVQGVLHFMRSLVPVKKGSILQAYLLANTYGGIPGLMNNLLNTLMHETFQKAVVNPIAEGVRAPLRREFGESVFVRGETKAQVMGFKAAVPDAIQLFMKTILNGEAPEIALKHGMLGLTEESGMKFGTGPRPVIEGPKGLLIEHSLRVLGGSDGMWRIVDGAGEANALMMVDAINAGHDAQAVADLVKFKTQPSSEQLARASTVTLRNTFNDSAKVGGFTQRMLHMLNTDYKGFAPGRVLVPAARFGIASAKHAVSLTPVGMVRGALKMKEAKAMEVGAPGRVDLAREGARQYIEGSLGSMMIVGADHAYDSGLITGAYPTDKKGQEKWALEKRQPMSMLIGGQWVPYSFFGPLAAPFMFTALIRDQQASLSDATIADRVERAAMGIGRYMTDIPAFSATYRLMDVIYSGVRYGVTTATDKFLASQITKAIPASATLNSLVPVWDHTERDMENVIERLQGRIPLLSTGLPPALTPEGLPKERPVSGPQSLVGAGGAEPQSLTGAASALAESGDTLLPIGNKIGGVDLNRDQFRHYLEVAGPLSTKAIDELVKKEEYSKETDPIVRQQLRNRAIDTARAEARKQVASDFVNAAKTEAEITDAAKMYRSQFDLRSTALLAQQLRTDSRLTDSVIAELDKTRGFTNGTEREPTVADMLKAAPLIQQYLDIPPYRQGDEAEWQRLKEARAEESKIRRDDPKKADQFHRDSALLRKYDNTALLNPARAAYRAKHPEVVPYISGTGYTQKAR